jgi:hypothetical protein
VKRLLKIGMILSVIYGLCWGGWVLVTHIALRQITTLAQQDGWGIQYDGPYHRGFPGVILTRLEQIDLRDGRGQWHWAAGGAGYLRQSLPDLSRARLHIPPHQVLTLGGQVITIGVSLDTWIGVDIGLFDAFALDRVHFEASDLAVSFDGAAPIFGFDQAQFDFSQINRGSGAYDMSLIARAVQVPQDSIDIFDPQATLPPQIDTMDAAARLQFDEPWRMGAQTDPELVQITLDHLGAEWGHLAFDLSGTIDIAPDGLPIGQLRLRVQNWQEIFDRANAAGLLGQRFTRTIEYFLAQSAQASGNPDNIDTILVLENGLAYLGDVPFAILPRLGAAHSSADHRQ